METVELLMHLAKTGWTHRPVHSRKQTARVKAVHFRPGESEKIWRYRAKEDSVCHNYLLLLALEDRPVPHLATAKQYAAILDGTPLEEVMQKRIKAIAFKKDDFDDTVYHQVVARRPRKVARRAARIKPPPAILDMFPGSGSASSSKSSSSTSSSSGSGGDSGPGEPSVPQQDDSGGASQNSGSDEAGKSGASSKRSSSSSSSHASGPPEDRPAGVPPEDPPERQPRLVQPGATRSREGRVPWGLNFYIAVGNGYEMICNNPKHKEKGGRGCRKQKTQENFGAEKNLRLLKHWAILGSSCASRKAHIDMWQEVVASPFAFPHCSASHLHSHSIAHDVAHLPFRWFAARRMIRRQTMST